MRKPPFLSSATHPGNWDCADEYSGIDAWTPLPATYTPLASGFIAGALFRSTKGPRAMAIAGTLVMGVAAAWQGVKRTLL